jgi:hypothetical protein
MQPLEYVQVEVKENVMVYRSDFDIILLGGLVRSVTSDVRQNCGYGCVLGAGSTRDDGENVYHSAGSEVAEGFIGEGCTYCE